MWQLPYYGDNIKKENLEYFSHLFGHEGENSVLSWLKAEGLALTLSASGTEMLNAFTFYTVSIELTKKGLANY